MKSTANILVPLDGSDLAEKALDVAIELVAPANGKVTLFVAAESAVAEGLNSFADSEQITRAMAADGLPRSG